MQKILYLHAGAEMYGADKVLLELIKGLDKEAFEAHVILPLSLIHICGNCWFIE